MMITFPKGIELDCGANAPGGGGFQPGNTCAKGDSIFPKTGTKIKKQRRDREEKLSILVSALQIVKEQEKEQKAKGIPNDPELKRLLKERRSLDSRICQLRKKIREGDKQKQVEFVHDKNVPKIAPPVLPPSDFSQSKITEILDEINPGGHVNPVFRVKTSSGDFAAYKPFVNEYELHNMSHLYKNEVAASVVDKALGWELVPETVLTEGKAPHGHGSMQKFVKAETMKRVNDTDKKVQGWAGEDQMIKLNSYDFIVGSLDRHNGNIKIDLNTKKVYAIDNGYSFPNTNRQDIAYRSNKLSPMPRWPGDDRHGAVLPRNPPVWLAKDLRNLISQKDRVTADLKPLLTGPKIESFWGGVSQLLDKVENNGTKDWRYRMPGGI